MCFDEGLLGSRLNWITASRYGDETDARVEVSGEFVVERSDAPEVLEAPVAGSMALRPL